MIAAFYSKRRAAKNEFIRGFLAGTNSAAVFVYPKNRRDEVPELPGVFCVAYEDVTKTEVWLHINSIMDGSSTLVLENPSRYPKITSEKFGHLKRLSMQVAHKAIVDIVPFTLDTEYLYTPLAYLDRGILGYAHYYAWRENYHERGDDGVVRAAHDPDVIAPQLAQVARIDYRQFLCANRTIVDVSMTEEEHDSYAAKKAELFGGYTSPQKIVTRLADHAHAFDSRRQALYQLLPLPGRTVIYTNLSSYATRLHADLKAQGLHKGVAVTSYQTGDNDEADNCIYFESPIVNSYYLLDAESKLPDTAKVYHFLSDAKVDQLLYSQLVSELEQINDLTKELWHEQENRKRLQSLSNQERFTGCTGADGMDLRYVQDSERVRVWWQGQHSHV